MPNKHFCQGPNCAYEQTTQDRFLKSRGVVRGRYAYATIRPMIMVIDLQTPISISALNLVSYEWLSINMTNIEQGRPIEFIRHRRESGGYHKVKDEGEYYSRTVIERVDTVRD